MHFTHNGKLFEKRMRTFNEKPRVCPKEWDMKWKSD